jgi:hypothetical protein
MSALAKLLGENTALDRLRELLASEPDTATRAYIEIELERSVGVDDAASFHGVHRDTFERNYPHLVKRFGPRLKTVRLRDVLTLPPPDTG